MTNLSYQMYSSRNFGPVEKTLEMVAGVGFKHVEGYGGMFSDIPAFAAALKSNGLTMSTSHVGLDQVESDPQGIIEMGKMVGLRSVYVPFVMPDDRPSDGIGWAEFGQRVAEAGAPLREAGLGFGWHNHDFEFVPCEDEMVPIISMIEAAPELELELDIAWVARAGEDPVAWINRLKDRLTAVHVKDIAPAGECANEDGWADVGHGTMDWAAINAALAGSAVHTAVCEHDNPSDDKRFATRSFATASKF